MISFWLAVATLLTVTTGFIFWPLIVASYDAQSNDIEKPTKHKKSAKVTAQTQLDSALSLQQARNVEIFKERLQELESEQQQGNLDVETFQQLKVELEKSLLNDVKLSDSVPPNKIILSLPHWLIAGLISITVIISSIALYQVLGRSDDYSRYLVLRDQGALNKGVDEKNEAPDFNRAITLLTEKLKQDPTDVNKWYLLANSYAATQQFNKVAEVFLRIQSLVSKDSPDYPAAKGAYAQALYLVNNEQMNDQVRTALGEALAIDPEEANSLVLKGIDAFEKNAYQEAIRHWEKAKVKANRTLTEQFITPSILAAQEKLGVKAPMSQTATSSARLELTVDIAAELKAKVSVDQVVFVFASPQGGKMPLAAQRIKVGELPAKIILDDTNAVMPTANLSSTPIVDVTARISLSGQAMAQPGDYFARKEGISVKQAQQPLSLVIDQVVPLVASTVPPLTSAPESPKVPPIAKLELVVDISSDLKAKATSDQVVFVFASPQGGKMPLAAQRIKVGELPAKITLDDTNAVMPTANLSSTPIVDVTARISLSGQAMAQSGDYYVRKERINVSEAQQPINLVIDKIVP